MDETPDNWIATRQADIGRFFGVSIDTVKSWAKQGMPGTPGAYDLSAIAQWLRGVGPWRQHGRGIDPDDDLLAGDGSPALERYRDEKAKIARLQRLELEKQLLRRGPVHETLGRFVGVWKQTADQLQRSGNESGYEAFVATVQAMEQEKDALLGDLRHLSEELDETNGELGGADTGD